MSNTVMPIQPIENGRFVKNAIVEYLLDSGSIDMNDLAVRSFSNQDRVQFAQLIGYSLDGFGTLSYVDDETYSSAEAMMSSGVPELEARNAVLRGKLESVRKGLRDSVVAVFEIHPDDLEFMENDK